MLNTQNKKGTQTLSGESAKPSHTISIGKANFKLRQGTKQHNVISEFLKGKKLSCLDHYWLGDTCLHSTVSALHKKYGLIIPRKWDKLPNRKGKLTRVKVYWFSDSDIAKIKPLIKGGCDE